MKRKFPGIMRAVVVALPLGLLLVACDHKEDPKAEAPPKAQVQPDLDANDEGDAMHNGEMPSQSNSASANARTRAL